jgi:hypothetical protein
MRHAPRQNPPVTGTRYSVPRSQKDRLARLERAVVAVRCDGCLAVFRDTLERESPCPVCGRIARGAA